MQGRKRGGTARIFDNTFIELEFLLNQKAWMDRHVPGVEVRGGFSLGWAFKMQLEVK